jgi:hypothetical protein
MSRIEYVDNVDAMEAIANVYGWEGDAMSENFTSFVEFILFVPAPIVIAFGWVAIIRRFYYQEYKRRNRR